MLVYIHAMFFIRLVEHEMWTYQKDFMEDLKSLTEKEVITQTVSHRAFLDFFNLCLFLLNSEDEQIKEKRYESFQNSKLVTFYLEQKLPKFERNWLNNSVHRSFTWFIPRTEHVVAFIVSGSVLQKIENLFSKRSKNLLKKFLQQNMVICLFWGR